MRPRPGHLLSFLTILTVVLPPGGAAQDRAIDPRIEERYQRGQDGGASWEAFASVPAVAFDAAGRLFILDAGNDRILQLDRAGRLIRIIGRSGRGPGELSRPTGMAVTPAGELVVFDAGIAAFSVFDTAGRYLRQSRPPIGPAYPGTRLRSHPAGVVSASGEGQALLAPGTSESPGYRLHAFPLMTESRPTFLARAWRPETGDWQRGAARAGQQVGVAALPALGPALHFDVLPDGSVLVVDSTTYDIKLWRPGATAPVHLRRPLTPKPTSAADRQAEVARRRERAEAMARPGAQPLGGGRAIDNLAFWPERAVIAGLRVGPGGLLWVERIGDGGPPPIDVLRPDGTYLGTMRSPRLRAPDAVGPDGLVAFIERGELDEPIVRVVSVSLP